MTKAVQRSYTGDYLFYSYSIDLQKVYIVGSYNIIICRDKYIQ